MFTRTRDFAQGFANSLMMLDQAILLPIYPAREVPIVGVSSEMIAGLMPGSSVKVMDKEEVLAWVKSNSPDVLMAIGAGDIDKLANEMAEILKSK